MSQNRQLAAIMFTDIEGYTALMQQDEKNAIQIRNKHRDIFKSITDKYKGELIQYYGEGTLSIFRSSVEAIKCGIEMQRAFQKEPAIPVRIGVHVGDIIRTEADIIGDAVNVASRIESLAVAGSIFISDKVNDQLRNQNDITTQFIDAFEFKNVNKSMSVFAIANQGIVVPQLSEVSGKTKEKESKSFKSYKRKSLILLLILVAVIITLIVNSKLISKATTISENRSIAVLPFENMSFDDDSELFTDGVTQDILLQLSKIKDLQVISRGSIMQYKGSNKTILEIAKELGVTYVLKGSVRKYGEKIRVNAQLINAGNNEYLWAENYDKTLTEIFEIQSQVSNEIAKALKITLSENEIISLYKAPTESTEAYNAYQEAQRFLNRGGGKVEELKKAENLFKKAIEIDPNFCRAYVGLSDTYLEYIYWGRAAPKEVLENALSPALKALEISPQEGGSYGALGSISFYRFERETAVSYLETAIEINPNYVGAYDKLAWIRLFEGNIDEAVRLFQKILKLDPLSVKNIGNIAFSHYYFYQFDKGIKVLNKALKKHHNNNMLLFMKACLLAGNKNYDEAIKTFNIRSAGTNTNWMLGYTYGVSGQREKALEILNYQLGKSETTFVPPYMICTIYMGLGDIENTLNWLERDFEVGGQGLFFWGLKRDVKFESIRKEPRFIALLNEIQ